MKTVVRNSYTPKTGDYCETIVVDKETENAYIFDCDGVFTEVPQPVDVERILREAKAYTDETVAPINEKLDTIEEGAQANKIETIKRNGVVIPISNKTVDVIVPTKTSDIINDGSAGTDTYVESAALDNYYTKTETDTLIESEETAREIADEGLQEQIDAIVASSDVVDIVGTYATLQAYDTSKLHDNDIIKVLADETKDEATTYYRWNKNTSTWSYIGAEGPFYTKAESDATFVPQTRTVNSKPLSSNITLTATDVGALPDSTAIPTVNNATLTIQKNGSTLNTFTANSSTNKTVDITVPTKVSDITNDLDFVSEEDIYNEQCESGTTITFQDSAPSKLSSFSISGNTVQNGTPTPDAPVAVQTVTGENVVKIEGKNLLYLSGLNATDNGVANTLNNDGSITCSGTVGSGWNGWTIMPYVPNSIQAGTYTLSIDHAINVGMNITFRDSSNTNIVAGNIPAGSTSATITLPRTAAKYSLWANGTTGTAISFTIKAQIELGSTATAFEPYQGQNYEVNLGDIELCKIGDYQDYIYKSGGKWYVRKEVGKFIYSGASSESWQKFENGGVVVWRSTTLPTGMISSSITSDLFKSNNFGYWVNNGTSVSTALQNGQFGFNGTATNINFKYSGVSKLADWTAWLSSHPTTVYYALATPTDTEITNEALVAQLEAILSQGYTYTGTNNITTVIAAGNVQGELEICYTNTILPLATKDTPGIVQVGDGLVVDSNGVVSATGLTSVEWDDIEDAPTNVSYFTNDAGYITPASLPAVNDGTLTIRKNGTNVATFSANQSGDATADISVPTKTSDLTNDSNFITTSALGNYYTKSETYTQGEVNSLINTISVPTKTSDLVNDSGFITSIPTASANTLGGIKVGTNLSIDANGVLSADAQSITVDSALSTASENPAQNKIITTALNSKADSSSIGNATLTIQKNGTNVQTFTANSSTDKTANIQVPNLQTSNTDPGEGAALAADTFLGVYDVAPSAIDGARITDGTITPAKTTFTTYSTTEKAVGEWIDGKTIYRKTVNVGALPDNASKNTAHGIPNLDTVIDCRGFAKATWGTQYPIPAVYASGDAGYNTQVSVDNTNITLSCTGNNSGKSGYVTIWYTKSS